MKDKLFAIPGINYPHPKNMVEVHLDSEEYPHNLKGPALVSPTGEAYYYTHGIQWDTETYQNFIKREISILDPTVKINDYPFSQLESIVLSARGFGKRHVFKETMVFSTPAKGGSGKTSTLVPLTIKGVERSPFEDYSLPQIPSPYYDTQYDLGIDYMKILKV